MTEILTESFCERCGTRYTFESTAPRKSRIGRVRTLSKGFRNFVLSDETTFSEAMADARSEEELATTAHQLDAFHKTFNFCMTCRQYTCGACWNEPEGRCLTCAPVTGLAEPEPLAAELPVLAAEALAANGHEEDLDLDEGAWPEIDLPADRIARAVEGQVAPPVTPDVGAAAGLDDGLGSAAAFSAAEASAAPGAPEVAQELDVARAPEVEQEPGAPAIAGMTPGQSLDDAIAAYEARMAAEEATLAGLEVTGATPVQGGEPAAAEIVEPPAAAEIVEPPAWAVPAEPAVPPDAGQAATEPATPGPTAPLAPSAPADDIVQQPTWPTPTTAPAASDGAPPVATPVPEPASPWLTVAPDAPVDPTRTPAPHWPSRAPQWPAADAGREVPRTFAGRPLLPEGDAAALWAASTREVLAPRPAAMPAAAPTPAAQPCISCGLSLSATARFCRRCGARQG